MKATELVASLTEDQLLTKVTDLARVRGWLTHHDRGDYRKCIQGDPGFPDLVLVRNRRILLVELKTSNGRLSVDQRKWFTALGAVDGNKSNPFRVTETADGSGLSVEVWRPDIFAMVEEILA